MTTSTQILAQFGQSNRAPSNTGTGFDTLNVGNDNLPEIPETTIYEHFAVSNTSKISAVSDTSLNKFEQYDPIFKSHDFLVNLGNMGSSTKTLSALPKINTGFDIGYHNYDPYRLNRDSFRFYKLNRPYSHFLFSPFAGQENYIIKAQFSRNFKNKVNFSIDYQKLDQEGFYNSQTTSSTYAGFGIWKKSKNREWFLTGIANANNEMTNGGITTDTIYTDSFYDRRDRIQVNLDDAITRHASINLSFINHFYFFREKENWLQNIKVNHLLAYESGSYKFYDELSTDLSLSQTELGVYGSFIADTRGIRNFSSYKNLEHRLGINLALGPLVIHQADLVYKYWDIYHEPINITKHDLYLEGKVQFNLNEQIYLTNNAYLNFGTNAGDLNLDNKININLTKDITIRSGLQLYAQSPSLIQNLGFVNQTPVWENEFAKTIGLKIMGSLEIQKLHTTLEISNESRNQAIYFDQEATPSQLDGNLNILQLSAVNKFRIGIFGAENELIFQSLNNNVYALPSILSKHNFYVQGLIFKKRMMARLGIETRYISSYTSQSFLPIFGAFYNASTTNDLPQNFLTNVYGTFKIDKFRAFIKFENLDQLMNRQARFYIHDHPLFDFKFRLGVSWLIKD